MTNPFNIAKCPTHGLHGQRTECFVCDGPIEQVPMIPVASIVDELEAVIEKAKTDYKLQQKVGFSLHHLIGIALYDRIEELKK